MLSVLLSFGVPSGERAAVRPDHPKALQFLDSLSAPATQMSCPSSYRGLDSATVPMKWYVITKPDGTGNLTKQHIERKIAATNNFYCGSDAATPPYNETEVAISPAFGVAGAMCNKKCAAYDPDCGADNQTQAASIARMTAACEADCKIKGNCDTAESCRVDYCYCDSPNYCKKWGTPFNVL